MTTENDGTTQQTGNEPAKDSGAPAVESQKPADKGAADPAAPADPFAELDADSREWLGKNGVKTAAEAAKFAREQAKLLGNAVRMPGPNATPEERAAFFEKLGRPSSPDGYEFTVPKDLPEGLPYDGERAKAFAAKAHELGIPKTSAQALHDWFAQTSVEDFKSTAEKTGQEVKTRAETATAALTKRWGPLDSPTAKANLEFADRTLALGGPEVKEALKAGGFIGPNDMVLSEPLAVFFAKIGSTLYKEDGVERGDPARINNPFDKATENRTEQAMAWKKDETNARALIAAAGRKPSDFGFRD